MSNIRVSDREHGDPGDRHYEFEPTFIMRGLTCMHIEFDPLG